MSTYPTTTGAYETSHFGDAAFVTKLNATGDTLLYSTLLSGSNAAKSYFCHQYCN